MILPEFETKYIASQTTTGVTTGKSMLHTVVCPIALTGTAKFQDLTGTPVEYFTLPIGSIGSFLFDSSMSNGLAVVTSAGDKLIITYQK